MAREGTLLCGTSLRSTIVGVCRRKGYKAYADSKGAVGASQSITEGMREIREGTRAGGAAEHGLSPRRGFAPTLWRTPVKESESAKYRDVCPTSRAGPRQAAGFSACQSPVSASMKPD